MRRRKTSAWQSKPYRLRPRLDEDQIALLRSISAAASMGPSRTSVSELVRRLIRRTGEEVLWQTGFFEAMLAKIADRKLGPGYWQPGGRVQLEVLLTPSELDLMEKIQGAMRKAGVNASFNSVVRAALRVVLDLEDALRWQIFMRHQQGGSGGAAPSDLDWRLRR